jgi:hypothetical protein
MPKLSRDEVARYMQNARLTERKNAEAIVTFSRGMVAALRDRAAYETAKELESLLFVYDAHIQELHQWLTDNGEQVLNVMIESLGGQAD